MTALPKPVMPLHMDPTKQPVERTASCGQATAPMMRGARPLCWRPAAHVYLFVFFFCQSVALALGFAHCKAREAAPVSKGRQRLQQSSGKAAHCAGEARRRLPGSASPGSHFTTSQQARPALNRGSPASMVDATRALLDELMGKERNVPLDERTGQSLKFSDPEVCKYALAGLCPYGLFKNTKSDLGAPLGCAPLAAGCMSGKQTTLPHQSSEFTVLWCLLCWPACPLWCQVGSAGTP